MHWPHHNEHSFQSNGFSSFSNRRTCMAVIASNVVSNLHCMSKMVIHLGAAANDWTTKCHE